MPGFDELGEFVPVDLGAGGDRRAHALPLLTRCHSQGQAIGTILGDEPLHRLPDHLERGGPVGIDVVGLQAAKFIVPGPTLLTSGPERPGCA
ncbi:hypothetical protein GCM10009605_42970 [Nocardiopsis composta]